MMRYSSSIITFAVHMKVLMASSIISNSPNSLKKISSDTRNRYIYNRPRQYRCHLILIIAFGCKTKAFQSVKIDSIVRFGH